MNEKDAFIQALTPTVMVPRFGSFEPLDRPGHRFLVAADGLWIEVRRAWLYARQRIARQVQVAMPYGQIDTVVQLLCPPIPAALVQQFSALARRESPLESAGWIVWDEHSGAFEFKTVQAITTSPGRIQYHRPVLAQGEHLVVDWHSHGTTKAFFSGTDNEDDKGEVKVSGVVGCCNQERADLALRLCLLGSFIKLDAVVTAEGILFKAAALDEEGGKSWSTSFTRSY